MIEKAIEQFEFFLEELCMKALVLVVLILSIFAFAGSTPAQSGFRLLDKIQVGGEGGWDILIADPRNHRLFVSHSTHVVVIDTSTDKVIGDIPKTNGVHGIGFGPEYGFTTNGRDNAVTMFSLKDLSVKNTIATGKNPDAIVYDRPTNRIFVFNGGSDDATVIDASTGSVDGTIEGSMIASQVNLAGSADLYFQHGSIVALGSTVMNMSGKIVSFTGNGSDNPPQMGLKFKGIFKPDAKTYREVHFGGG